MKKESKR